MMPFKRMSGGEARQIIRIGLHGFLHRFFSFGAGGRRQRGGMITCIRRGAAPVNAPDRVADQAVRRGEFQDFQRRSGRVRLLEDGAM